MGRHFKGPETVHGFRLLDSDIGEMGISPYYCAISVKLGPVALGGGRQCCLTKGFAIRS